MSEENNYTAIFEDLKNLKQFANMKENMLLNMLNGCKVTYKPATKEYKGTQGVVMYIPATKSSLEISWDEERKAKLSIDEAQIFLELMKKQ